MENKSFSLKNIMKLYIKLIIGIVIIPIVLLIIINLNGYQINLAFDEGDSYCYDQGWIIRKDCGAP